jgi:hypothetical protein
MACLWGGPVSVLFAWVSRMGNPHGSRRRQLARLQLEIAKASRRLEEIEKMSFRRRSGIGGSIAEIPNQQFENAETRFAAFVASGMSKMRSDPGA